MRSQLVTPKHEVLREVFSRPKKSRRNWHFGPLWHPNIWLAHEIRSCLESRFGGKKLRKHPDQFRLLANFPTCPMRIGFHQQPPAGNPHVAYRYELYERWPSKKTSFYCETWSPRIFNRSQGQAKKQTLHETLRGDVWGQVQYLATMRVVQHVVHQGPVQVVTMQRLHFVC